MRLWSIHPKYLDSKGLVALWREALLAKKVLQNKTTGYKNHPQLERFKNTNDSFLYLNNYLKEIHNESIRRNYNFDSNKIGVNNKLKKIHVTSGQINYEFQHLLKKLKGRDRIRYNNLKNLKKIEVFPGFKEVPGLIEIWEKTKSL
ncbi:pyrimidine dimer DNA glycosylase/endonuclease V [Bacteroidota bacterium]